MIEHINIRDCARFIKDISTYGIELGFPFNPVGNFTMSKMDDGNWLCYMRVFPYYITSYGRYRASDRLKLDNPDRHLFISLDDDFNIIRRIPNPESTYHIDEVFNKEKPYLEDGRLVNWSGQFYLASATFYQQNQHWQKMAMEIQKLSIHDDGIHATHFFNSIESGITGRQKNWMAVPDIPFTYIIGTSQTGSNALDISTNKITTIGQYDEGGLYRGNSNLIKIDDGYIAITHRQLSDDAGRIYYLNYLIQYSNELMPIRISRPFKLTNEPIEFITMMLDVDEGFLIGVTAMDDSPEIMRFDKSTLMGLFV